MKKSRLRMELLVFVKLFVGHRNTKHWETILEKDNCNGIGTLFLELRFRFHIRPKIKCGAVYFVSIF